MTQTTFANGINPFERLGKLPAEPKPTMQKPAKPVKTKSKKEDYFMAYEPPVRPTQAESNAAAKAATQAKDSLGLTITNDALPAHRALPLHKYHAVFEGMKMGQSVRCPTSSVGKVSGAMRKYIEIKSLRAHVKSMTRFEGDTGYGRVWLIASAAKALKVAA